MGGNPTGMQRGSNMAPINVGRDPFTGQPLGPGNQLGLGGNAPTDSMVRRPRKFPKLDWLNNGKGAAGVPLVIGGGSDMIPGAGGGGNPRGPVVSG